MVEPMVPRVLARGVKTVEKGRVDRVFEIVHPHVLWSAGEHQFICMEGDWICAGELPTASFYRGGLVLCSLRGGWWGWR